MNSPTTTPEPTLDARYVLDKLRANWGLILGLPILFVAAALGYTMRSQPLYKAETTLYFPRGQSSVLGSIGAVSSEQAGGLAGLGNAPTSIKIFHRFLESETCLDYVSRASGIKARDIESSRKFEEDPGASMLTISIVLPDGQAAKDLLADHLRALSQINDKISRSYIADDAAAIQQELAAQKEKLSQAEQSLVDFQKKADSAPSTAPSQWQARLLQAKVDLASTRSSIRTASAVYRKSLGAAGLSPSDIPPVQKLRPRLVDAEYQLNVLTTSLGPDAPEVRHLKADVDNLKDELKSEVAAYVASVNRGMVDPTAGGSSSDQTKVNGMLEQEVSLESEIEALGRLARVAPMEQGTLAHLALQVSIQSDLVKQATLQLEATKLQSLRDPNTWSLLDPPWTDPKPVNKKYLQVSIMAALSGLLLSCVWAFNFGRTPKPR